MWGFVRSGSERAAPDWAVPGGFGLSAMTVDMTATGFSSDPTHRRTSDAYAAFPPMIQRRVSNADVILRSVRISSTANTRNVNDMMSRTVKDTHLP
ncbi:hypothetical protein PBRA_003342 [Plasmodiophora brassicae]|uniref:Uncharacterized protein n=1 Tax=Plasmodiophora brassicae TaxID=37360 RepID=A0A0G4J850_PLABS|nr:hypothetical protein PBRA_003342 [Plasmodiophora brassicae]